MQVRQLEDSANKKALEECQTRVQAIALIHEKLYQYSDYSHVPFSAYARTLVMGIFHAAGLSPPNVALELAIENIALPVDRAIPCGLILNELIMNALKHGFKDGRPGTLRVELVRLETGRLRLAVRDDGAGLPAGLDFNTVGSLGLQLVSTLSEQLGAELEVSGPPGAYFELTFSLGGEVV
jgi:two-component sensor histidine kinase